MPPMHPLVRGALEVLGRWGSEETERLRMEGDYLAADEHAKRDRAEWYELVRAAGPPLVLDERGVVAALLVPARFCAPHYDGSEESRLLITRALAACDEFVAGNEPAANDVEELGRTVEQLFFQARAASESAMQRFTALMNSGGDSDTAADEADTASQSRRAALSVAQAMAALGWAMELSGSWVTADEEALETLCRFAGQNAAEFANVLEDRPGRRKLVADLLAATHGTAD